MPARGMFDAIPHKIDEGLYACELCKKAFPYENLFWTFWRQPQGWVLWPFIRRPHDPCYGYVCARCREIDSRVDSDFVPATPLINVVTKLEEKNRRNIEHFQKYGRSVPEYECWSHQEPDGTWVIASAESEKIRTWIQTGGSGMWTYIIHRKLNLNQGPAEFVGRGYLSEWEAVQAMQDHKPDWKREVDEREENSNDSDNG